MAAKISPLSPRDTDLTLVRRALLLLGERWDQQPELGWLARSVGVSESHLQRLFTRLVGISPKRFLQFLTKEAARASLADAQSLLETAHACGLSGASRLHDLFIRYEGLSPGEFKTAAAGLTLHSGTIETPFGEAFVVWAPRGLNRLEFFDTYVQMEALRRTAQADFAGALWAPLTDAHRTQLENAFNRAPQAASLQLCVQGSAIQLKVWEALMAIPPGRTVSYQGLANALQLEAVGEVVEAVTANALAWLIPCHRVIREEGSLGGARWGAARKAAMLSMERAASA